MSFSDIWNGPTFLNRKRAMRWGEKDKLDEEAKRKREKNDKKQIKHEHFRKDWDVDLWDWEQKQYHKYWGTHELIFKGEEWK